MHNILAESKKPFPAWIKEHPVFASYPHDKVFPKLGMKNFRETIEVAQSDVAKNAAHQLIYQIRNHLDYVRVDVHNKLSLLLVSANKDNALCAKYQAIINIIDIVKQSLSYNDYIKVLDKKVQLKLRSDLFHGESVNPLFKKDESIIRVVNKIFKMVKEANKAIAVPNMEQWFEFKEFSRLNVPFKKYTVVFSSTGEEGLWDMATISMRGISSCQAWSAPQSRGLIGALSSKYAGVIFIESDENTQCGKKMTFRCMVRLAMRGTSPVLVMDSMYGGRTEEIVQAYKRILKEKTGLDVFFTAEIGGVSMPDEPSRKLLKNGEFPYMDANVPVVSNKTLINKAKSTFNSTSFIDSIVNEVGAKITAQRSVYQTAEKQLEEKKAEWSKAKDKWIAETGNIPEPHRTQFELERPKMDADISAFGKGGVMNLLKHCDKKHGAESAGKLFAKHILDTTDMSNCTSIKEAAIACVKRIDKQAAWKKIEGGSWMKSFPKSSEQFFNYALSQVKNTLKKHGLEAHKKAN